MVIKRLSDEDRRRIDGIIEAHGRHMSQRDLAHRAGCSLGYVNKRIRQLVPDRVPVAEFDGTGRDRSASRIERLVELRDALFGLMRQTGGRDLARLSREYRATLADIAGIAGSRTQHLVP